MRSRARHSRQAALVRHPAFTEKELEAPPGSIPVGDRKALALGSPVEDLGLSVRTRNALRGIGCDTLQDALALDLSSSVRGLGRKTRDELLTALVQTGFRRPAQEQEPGSEMRLLERSLERMQDRVEAALGVVAKEIRLIRQRLRKVGPKGGD